MFLQLADNDTDTMNGDNYDTLRTTQGNLFIRKDLSAGGKGAAAVSKASGLLGKVAQFAPIPGAAAISKGLNKTSEISKKVAAAKGKNAINTITAAIPTKKPLIKLQTKKTPTAATPTAVMPTATMPVMVEEKESFLKRYRTPLLIGGGVLLVGAAILLLRKKK